MNPYHNPVFLLKILKSYLTEIDRIWHTTPEKLEKLQDKEFKKMVKYAYTVPLYHEKYKKAGVKPYDINGIKDIKKLPIITKNDLRDNYPNGIVPKKFDKKNSFLVSTSGSTGKPVFCYYSILTAIKFTIGGMRSLKPTGAVWNKSKMCLIIDMKEGSVEKASYEDAFTPFFKRVLKTDNILYLHVGDPLNKILEKVKKFNPEYLTSDPNMLRQLANLKINGKLDYLNPKWLYSGSAMLDDYTRKYVEKAFNAKIFDNYNSTEAGNMAFQCLEKKGFHVNSDYLHMEFLDDNGEDVEYNKPSRLHVTRLFGYDTPIIRYNGLDDIVTPIEPLNCCGVTTLQMIKDIHGRKMEFIYLPSGKKIAPFKITTIPASVMDKLDTYKIKQFQIIQHKIDLVEVKIIIDEKLRNIGPSVKKIKEEIFSEFKKVTFDEIEIKVNEVKDINKDLKSNLVKVVISKIKQK